MVKVKSASLQFSPPTKDTSVRYARDEGLSR